MEKSTSCHGEKSEELMIRILLLFNWWPKRKNQEKLYQLIPKKKLTIKEKFYLLLFPQPVLKSFLSLNMRFSQVFMVDRLFNLSLSWKINFKTLIDFQIICSTKLNNTQNWLSECFKVNSFNNFLERDFSRLSKFCMIPAPWFLKSVWY